MQDELDTFFDASISMLKKNHKSFKDSRLMRVETFNLIQETLEKYTGKAALVLLQRFGELNAEIIINEKKFNNKKLKDLINKSINFGLKNKWFILNNIDFTSNAISIKFNSTFESAVHLAVNFTVCAFLEGFFKKISNSSKEKAICLCEETKCIAKGDDFCEFRIKRIG